MLIEPEIPEGFYRSKDQMRSDFGGEGPFERKMLNLIETFSALGELSITALQPTTGTYRIKDFVSAANSNIPAVVTRVLVEAYDETYGVSSAAWYRAVPSEPSHDMKFLSRGRWWALDEKIATPQMAGAKGDNVADDSAALQRIFYAADCIWIPPGNYKFTTRLRLKERTIVFGNRGSSFLHRSGQGDLCNWPVEQDRGQSPTWTGYSGWSNIYLRDLVIDAHGDTIDVAQNVVTFNHARNIVVKGCIIRNTVGFHALEFNGVENYLAEDSLFEGYRVTAETASVDREAIQIDSASVSADSGATDGTYCKSGVIRRCRFTASAELPAHPVGIGSHGEPMLSVKSDDLTIEDCFFRSAKHGISNQYSTFWKIYRNNIAGTSSNAIRNFVANAVKCQGNQIDNCLNHAISLLDKCQSGHIFGNTINGGQIGIYVDCGAGYIGGVHNIGANTITNTSSYAITVTRARDILIIGNYILGAGYTSGAASAIRVSNSAGNSTGVTIICNKVRPHGAGTEVTAAVSIEGSTDTLVDNNDFEGIALDVTGTYIQTRNRTTAQQIDHLGTLIPAAFLPSGTQHYLGGGATNGAYSALGFGGSSVPGFRAVGLGGTASAPSNTADLQYIGGMEAWGQSPSGSAPELLAKIVGKARDVSGANIGADLIFATKSGAGALTERFIISRNGGLFSSDNEVQDIGANANKLRNVFALNMRIGPTSVVVTAVAGSPEGVVTAPVGSLCTDTTNGVAYMKKTGTGNTGWKLVTQAA